MLYFGKVCWAKALVSHSQRQQRRNGKAERRRRYDQFSSSSRISREKSFAIEERKDAKHVIDCEFWEWVMFFEIGLDRRS